MIYTLGLKTINTNMMIGNSVIIPPHIDHVRLTEVYSSLNRPVAISAAAIRTSARNLGPDIIPHINAIITSNTNELPNHIS